MWRINGLTLALLYITEEVYGVCTQSADSLVKKLNRWQAADLYNVLSKCLRKWILLFALPGMVHYLFYLDQMDTDFVNVEETSQWASYLKEE